MRHRDLCRNHNLQSGYLSVLLSWQSNHRRCQWSSDGSDVVCVDSVYTIGLYIYIGFDFHPEYRKAYINFIKTAEIETNRLITSAVHVDILQQDVLGVIDRHGPHLTIQESDILKHTVAGSSDGDLMRSSWAVPTSNPQKWSSGFYKYPRTILAAREEPLHIIRASARLVTW